MTSSNGNIFRVTGHLCGKFTGPRWISRTKASDAELWCFFDLHLNKRLSKQPWGWWFETPEWSLWRHRNVNSLRPRQNGRHFADDIFKCIFVDENVRIPIKISIKFVPKGPINNIPALFQIMAWRRPGDKPLSEPMMLSLTTHICVTRPQWVLNVTWGPFD